MLLVVSASLYLRDSAAFESERYRLTCVRCAQVRVSYSFQHTKFIGALAAHSPRTAQRLWLSQHAPLGELHVMITEARGLPKMDRFSHTDSCVLHHRCTGHEAIRVTLLVQCICVGMLAFNLVRSGRRPL
jgi:hypothetical protein|eukprot:SAG25_NODE_24_length_22161_cov_23.692405_17_plen_130_part_00